MWKSLVLSNKRFVLNQYKFYSSKAYESVKGLWKTSSLLGLKLPPIIVPNIPIHHEYNTVKEIVHKWEDSYLNENMTKVYCKFNFPLHVSLMHPKTRSTDRLVSAAKNISLIFAIDSALELFQTQHDMNRVRSYSQNILNLLNDQPFDRSCRTALAFRGLLDELRPSMRPYQYRLLVMGWKTYIKVENYITIFYNNPKILLPIELYIDFRRVYGGVALTDIMVDYTCDADFETYRKNKHLFQLNMLVNDNIVLLNDLYSVNKEFLHLELNNNYAILYALTYGCALQRAIDVTFEMITSIERKIQLLCDEILGNQELATEEVRLYIEAQMDFLNGMRVWHDMTGRYKNNANYLINDTIKKRIEDIHSNSSSAEVYEFKRAHISYHKNLEDIIGNDWIYFKESLA